jgi:hypothetical protein
MLSILVAVAGLVGLALAYKLVTARPNPRFNLHPGPYPDPHPNQDKLVELLIADATGTDADGLANFVRKQRWGGTELRNRLICARNSIRLIAEPAVSKRVDQTVRRMIWESLIWGVSYHNDPDSERDRGS